MKKLVIILSSFITCLVGVKFCYSQAYRFERYGIEEGLANETITDICQDIYGNLWVATQGGGVSKFDGKKFFNITAKDGLNSNDIRKLATDSIGNLWIATAEGLAKYNERELKTFDYKEGVINQSVNTLLVDQHNNLWYATSRPGIYLLHPSGTKTFFDFSNGFVNDRVIDIKMTSDGTVWLVTIVNGLYKYAGGKFTQVLSTNKLNKHILSLSVKNDKILLATNKGVVSYDKDLTSIGQLNNVFVRALVQKEDNLWIITANSLLRAQGNQIQQFSTKQGYTSAFTNVGFQDREGNLWWGTSGDGLWKFSGFTISKYDQRHGLQVPDVLSIAKDSTGSIWVGTNGGGIYQLQKGRFARLDGGGGGGGIEKQLYHFYYSRIRGSIMDRH